jgi:peptidyl-prolyl cis-trans isomerase C
MSRFSAKTKFCYLKFSKYLVPAMMVLSLSPAIAADKKTEKAPLDKPVTPSTILTVNGTPILGAAVDEAMANLRAQGVQGTPQLRDQVINELVVREVLSKEASRLDLDKTALFKKKMDEVRKNLLSEALWLDYSSKHPITEQEEHAEYDRQKKLLGGGDSTPQYLVSDISLETEAEAKEALQRIQKGEDFAKVAEAVSRDESTKRKGGEIGWVLPAQIAPIISNVMVNLGKGKTVSAPIQTPTGWHIIKVNDIRDFKLPAFEETRTQLKQSLQTQQRQKMIDELLKKADIKKP